MRFDGACATNPGPSSAGVVIFRNGEPVKSWGRYLGLGTSNSAELTGAFMAVRWLSAHNVRNATVVGDSRLVVNYLTGQWRCRSGSLRGKCEQAKALVRETGTKVVWEPRETNTLAHEAAHRALNPPVMDELKARSRALEFLPVTRPFTKVRRVAA